MIKRLLVFAATIALALAACPVNDNIPNVQIGAITFTVQNSQQDISTQNFEYSFQNSFDADPNVALALTAFSIRSANFTQWDISPESTSRVGTKVRFQQQPPYWINVKVNFIASANQNLVVGNSMAVFQPIKNNMAVFNININRQVPDISKAMSKAYLTGYRRISGNSMQIKIMSREITANAITVYIQTGDDLEINTARINFIIFSTNQFNMFGKGISRKDYAGTFVESIQKQIYTPKYAFYGLMYFEFSSQGSFDIKANLIDSFYVQFEISRTVDDFGYYFLVLGSRGRDLCASCTQRYSYKQQCVNSCPADSYLSNSKDGSSHCMVCPVSLNMVVNNARNGCTCASGYTQKDGFCQSSGAQNSNINILPRQDAVVGPFQGSNVRIDLNPNKEKEETTITQPSKTVIPNNSFIPIIGVNEPTPQSRIPDVAQVQEPEAVKPAPTVVDCSNMPNSYSVGHRCVCKVGYEFRDGLCLSKSLIADPNIFKPSQFIYSISFLYTNQKPICAGANEVYDGQACNCLPNFKRDTNGQCTRDIPDIICPPNSRAENNACVCLQGYVKYQNKCIPENKCPSNSIYNGIECICNAGYHMRKGECIFGQPCPPFSERMNGKCQCVTGYIQINGKCTRCPEGQVYIPSQNQCVVTCGVNQIVNPRTQKCECKPGYGKHEQICKICPANFFIFNGYCVSCPIGSQYSHDQGKCVCGEGLILHTQGFCQQICQKSNQFYHGPSKSCKCIQGLARVNGECGLCQSGRIDPNTQACLNNCEENEIQINGRCNCKAGFGFNSNGKCIDCTTIAGGFIIGSYCATCPIGQKRVGNQCRCPIGQELRNNKCTELCRPGQLIDAQGNCYECPINQEIKNGQCECISGYVKKGNYCIQQCKNNQVVINGFCGVCALNTVYNPELKVCACPTGFYMTNNGICEQSRLPPIQCPVGKYFDPKEGCLNCPSGCSQCQNALKCTKCLNPNFIPQGSECRPQCGDKNIHSSEQCDDGNSVSGDGCSNTCRIEPNYRCTGAPSVCTKCGDGKITGSEKCDDKNMNNGDGCSQTCQIENGYVCRGEPSVCTQGTVPNFGMSLARDNIYNFNTVFVGLRTDKSFILQSRSEVENFMKYEFPASGTEPSSVYCRQDDPRLFYCMLNYASGLPTNAFKVNFSFDHKGDRGFLAVDINPLASIQARSLS